MESQRNFIFIALLIVSLLLWQNWLLDKHQVNNDTVQLQNNENYQEKNTMHFSDMNKEMIASMDKVQIDRKNIEVQTDVLNVSISNYGGDIVFVSLPKFHVSQDNHVPLTLLHDENGEELYIAQSGLIGQNGLDNKLKRVLYRFEKDSYFLQADENELVVSLFYRDERNIDYEKRFIFTRNRYDVKIEYRIHNHSQHDSLYVQMYTQLKRTIEDKSEKSFMMPIYRGGAYSTNHLRYEKYSFDKMKEKNLSEMDTGGWVAMLQHYFVSAWIPVEQEEHYFYSKVIDEKAIIGLKGELVEILPNEKRTLSSVFYAGPKDQDELAQLSPTLNLVVDYGWLWFIAQPLYFLLKLFYQFLHNWGFAIVVLTLLIRGLLYPLTKAQYTSMAKMRQLQPKLADLKSRFGDDRQKMSQEMMELYRKEKVNPMGGCFPILLQFPIFIAFYWVLLESVELRHSPFILWITDLSVKDPYYVLPLLNGVSMFIMQRMQPPMATMDPLQQKMMQYMPVMFTFFFLWFPSGLVLYWLVGNIISITQQIVIYRNLEKQGLYQR